MARDTPALRRRGPHMTSDLPDPDTEIPAQPAADGRPLNLIDPKLKARALKRLQGIIKGNGVKIEDVKLVDCQALVYPFSARTFVKLTPQYGVRTEPGLNKTSELAVSVEDFNRSLKGSVVQTRTEPPKRKSVIDFLFERPDKGFGMKDQKVSFHALKRDFVMHEGCITCSKIGRVQCQKCRATGMIGCALCQGRKQITCPHCRGSGKTPGSNQAHSCVKCRGDGKIMCHQCGGRGQTQCQTCAATGQMKCSKCAGTGWLSHLAHVEMEAMIHFDFERHVLPLEVQKMIEAFGSRLVEKNDVEVVLRPMPATAQDIADEIRLKNEPDDMIFIDYDAKVPFGQIQFSIRGRTIPATLFGYGGKLIEAPAFLDDITKKGQQVLLAAAEGRGDVAEKIRRAAKYRMLCDIVIQAAGKAKQRQAIEILTNRYPTGISSERLLALLIQADKALKNVTRKPRAAGLLAGLALLALACGLYFAGPGRLQAEAAGIPAAALTASDFLLLPFGIFIATLSAQIASLFAQKRAIAGLAPPEMITRTMPKAGKTIWWAASGAALIWGGCVAASVLMPDAHAPAWALRLYDMLQN